MNGTANLSPGSIVPKTGKYKCEFCGEGGMASFFAKSLKEQGPGLDVTQLEGTSRQSTMRFFEAGKTLPECPTCGPATGWSLVAGAAYETRRPAAHHGQTVAESAVCDVCNQKVNRPAGFLLTTRQVVSTPGYWQQYYRHHEAELAEVGIHSFEDFRENPATRSSVGEPLASQSTAWMVCGECIGMFPVDRTQVRSYAKEWWESERTFSPPGTGPAPLSAIDMGAGSKAHETTTAPPTAGSKADKILKELLEKAAALKIVPASLRPVLEQLPPLQKREKSRGNGVITFSLAVGVAAGFVIRSEFEWHGFLCFLGGLAIFFVVAAILLQISVEKPRKDALAALAREHNCEPRHLAELYTALQTEESLFDDVRANLDSLAGRPYSSDLNERLGEAVISALLQTSLVELLTPGADLEEQKKKARGQLDVIRGLEETHRFNTFFLKGKAIFLKVEKVLANREKILWNLERLPGDFPAETEV